jgi:predicted GIY-YIG superfamily endonuclease
MFVYFLLCTDGSTYIGATVDLERRLRQHNKEIKGGAHATGMKVALGKSWCRVCHVSGFPDWKSTLQFEWRWKQISRTLSKTLKPIDRRLMALHRLLHLERPTTKALSYSEWEQKPHVHMELFIDLFSVYFQESEENPYVLV